MKATIDIPDDLYRQVKAKVVLEQTRIRDVTMGLYRRWLAGEVVIPDTIQEPEPTRAVEDLARSFRRIDEILANVPGDDSTGEFLEQGRGRLENPDR